jgi:hypothetical protein
MSTPHSGELATQLLQGVQKLNLDVQDLKTRVVRLDARMDRLEASNRQILEQLQRITKASSEPAAHGHTHGDLSAYLDTLEQRIMALKR